MEMAHPIVSAQQSSSPHLVLKEMTAILFGYCQAFLEVKIFNYLGHSCIIWMAISTLAIGAEASVCWTDISDPGSPLLSVFKSISILQKERREHLVFERLLDSYPGLLERLKEGSEEELLHVGELIAPAGQAVVPPLPRNSKISRGFNHPLTGRLLCPAELDWDDADTKQNLQSGEIAVSGDQWPLFVYANEAYDPEDPWNGLLRSRLLVNAFRHIFTSPSSVDKEPKATRAGNARLHVFSRTDTVTDSETFYHSLLDLLEDPDECGEVTELLLWWNRQVNMYSEMFKPLQLFSQIFPTSSAAKRPLKANSALSKIRQKRAALKDADGGTT
ncbi:hypothetical protein C8R48DRAFT_771259 [Suillus tomentosus]|nr:hypothetical protein C8R48DRAFT_771259 [Suillus tomentosus]